MDCQEKVTQYLSTRFGVIGFERHKVKYKDKARFGFLLDDIPGLRPYHDETRLSEAACPGVGH